MKSILKNSNGNAVSTGGKLFTVSANYTDQIKQALIDKGVATEDTPSTDIPNVVKSLSLLKPYLDVMKNCNNFFQKFTGTSVDHLISYNDTENVENMYNMYGDSRSLKTLPFLNTKNVKDMSYICYQCFALEKVQLDTSSLENASSMFFNCKIIQTIDITSLDKISSTNYISSFARSCGSLIKLIIRTMTVIPPLNTNSFSSCYHFLGTVDSTYNPDGLKDGRIYVPDDMVDQLKEATNWSEFADIIVPLSTLVED